ncbi:MAG: glycosyltransferase family 9 protein [Candidatus Methylomirabilia bacterium]
MTPLDPAEIQTLLVRLPNWLGDTVMALPALRALRAGLATAEITLVGPWVELFADQGVADQVLTYPKSLPRRLAMSRRLRAMGRHDVLLLTNSLESALAARSWGARRRIGFATDGRGWLLTHPVTPPSPRRHQVDEYLELLRVFGVASNDSAPRLSPSPGGGDERVDSLLGQAGASPDAALVGLHLGAAFGPSKRWSIDRWVGLALALGSNGAHPILIGSPAEDSVAAEVCQRCPTPVASLVGRDSPAILPRLLGRFHLVIAGDTGVAHLAAALGVPVITLFGPTDPRLTAPRGARVRSIYKAVPCAPCFLVDCPINHPCMSGIGVDEVLEQASAFLKAAQT